VLPAEIRDLHALAVDDNDAARQVMTDMLRTLGLRAEACASGAEAISAVRACDHDDPIRLMVIDWNMPGMDGIATASAIRSDTALQSVPKVVVVTAFGREEIRARAETAGLDAFLLKPVSQSTLFDTLVNLFVPEQRKDFRDHSKRIEERWSLRGTCILLAEDNEINQQIAVELLEGVGAQVEVANDGREAVEKLDHGGAEKFDAVLMDLQMPDMDGYTAARHIRDDPRFKSLPVIAMTAHALAEERERCLAAGMNDHITKPIDPDVMFQTLLRWLPVTGSATAAGAPGVPMEGEAASTVLCIAGVDTKSGLRRVVGNGKLYRELLRKYVSGQAGAVAAIRQALAAGDRPLAERLAHTAKGVSGNIGAVAVQEAAAVLESAIRAGAESETMIVALDRILGATIDAICRVPAIVSGYGGADKPLAGHASPGPLIEKLSTFLTEGSTEAIDYLAEHAEVMRASMGEGEFESIREALDSFDFDRALAKLRTINYMEGT
jgi:two-component system sensor histidine kinase/response regulator